MINLYEIVKFLKRTLLKFKSYFNEVKFLMVGIVALYYTNKLIDFYNEYTGQAIGKWSYSYVSIEIYSLVRLGILALGIKFIMHMMMPSLDKYLELQFDEFFTKTEISSTNKWKMSIAWLVYFALLFGAIMLSNGQAGGLQN